MQRFSIFSISTNTLHSMVLERADRAWLAIGKLRSIFFSKIRDANKMRLLKSAVVVVVVIELPQAP